VQLIAWRAFKSYLILPWVHVPACGYSAVHWLRSKRKLRALGAHEVSVVPAALIPYRAIAAACTDVCGGLLKVRFRNRLPLCGFHAEPLLLNALGSCLLLSHLCLMLAVPSTFRPALCLPG
jgi:hypothetical protein